MLVQLKKTDYDAKITEIENEIPHNIDLTKMTYSVKNY